MKCFTYENCVIRMRTCPIKLIQKVITKEVKTVSPRGSTQYNDNPGMCLPIGFHFQLKFRDMVIPLAYFGTGLCFLHLYSGTGLYCLRLYSGTYQIVVKNSNILPKSSCSKRLHKDDSEQKMYQIESLALDHG